MLTKCNLVKYFTRLDNDTLHYYIVGDITFILSYTNLPVHHQPSTADFSLLRWTAPNEAASQRSPTKSTSCVTRDLSCWARLSVSAKPTERGAERRPFVKVLDSGSSHTAVFPVSYKSSVLFFFNPQPSIVVTSPCPWMAAWMATWQRFPTKFNLVATVVSIFLGPMSENAKPTEPGVEWRLRAKVLILLHDYGLWWLVVTSGKLGGMIRTMMMARPLLHLHPLPSPVHLLPPCNWPALPKWMGSWFRINTAKGLGIVWRDRIRARNRKNATSHNRCVPGCTNR